MIEIQVNQISGDCNNDNFVFRILFVIRKEFIMKRNKKSIRFNGNLPQYVFDFQDGEYICEIEGFSLSERDSDKLVVKICTIEEEVSNMVFKMYYDLSGASLCRTSPLGRLLKELELIHKNKIQWEKLTGQQVLADIVTSIIQFK